MTPANEPPFRATFRDAYIRGHVDHPSDGQVIRVLYHPGSHKVKLDADDWKFVTDDDKQAQEDRFEAAAHGAPGEAPAPKGTPDDE